MMALAVSSLGQYGVACKLECQESLGESVKEQVLELGRESGQEYDKASAEYICEL